MCSVIRVLCMCVCVCVCLLFHSVGFSPLRRDFFFGFRFSGAGKNCFYVAVCPQESTFEPFDSAAKCCVFCSRPTPRGPIVASVQFEISHKVFVMRVCVSFCGRVCFAFFLNGVWRSDLVQMIKIIFCRLRTVEDKRSNTENIFLSLGNARLLMI